VHVEHTHTHTHTHAHTQTRTHTQERTEAVFVDLMHAPALPDDPDHWGLVRLCMCVYVCL
jgi:hypothetical protein